MNLSVTDRIHLLGILPSIGDFTTLKIIRSLREELSFSEADHALLGIKVDGDKINWNPAADNGKEIEIGPKAFLIIAEALESLEKQKTLKLEHLELYEKFVESQSKQ